MATDRSRRHRGEGSIYQRESDGRWVGVLDLGMVGGKRVRKTVTAPTLAKLKPKFAKLKRETDAGVLTDNISVEQWMNQWLDLIAAERNAPSTMRGYRQKTARWIVPHLGNIRLDRLRPDHIRALYVTMREQGKSGSATHVHAILRRALTIAERDSRISFNPADRVDPPTGSQTTHGKLTLPEAQRVLTALATREDAARWTLALLAGIRQGEALGLRWEDVDLAANMIQVRRAAQDIKGHGMMIVPLKNTRGKNRVQPIDPADTDAIAAMPVNGKERNVPLVSPVAYALAHMPGPREGFVFGGVKPSPPRRDHKEWTALLASCDVPHKPLHAARATTASLLSEAGVPPKIIAEIMGHSQVQVTERHYISGDERVHVNAMGALEALVLGE